jgi:hypothetical protein
MKTIEVAQFRISDVDKSELYANTHIYEWLQTESGRWVKEHAIGNLTTTSYLDFDYMGHKFRITAKFEDKDATYFILKYKK